MYYAHSLEDRPEEYWQLLKDHLLAVQKEAADRGRKFGAGKAAGQAGLFHDIGKYTKPYQKRLRGGPAVDHATAGAKMVNTLADAAMDRAMAQLIAYAIAGHHGGLPDMHREIASLYFCKK